MGNCGSSNTEQNRISKNHDRKIEEEQQAKREEVKLLLLGNLERILCQVFLEINYKLVKTGTGESGKSTVFKQMKVIQVGGGFTNDDFVSFKYVVYGNCINQMKVVINAVSKLGLNYQDPNNNVSFPFFFSFYSFQITME